MSKTVDERVVSMQFDNKNFEKNVSTTLSSLDKLKKSLKFDGASKGLENISKSASKVDLSGMNKAVETIQAKFSALDVMAVTALANITNTAFNAGKRIMSALTIDPIKTGFQEYETQINAVQTILANTQSKGTTLKDVNAALDELNKYADLTIYNFTEMTRNIGTFTAAGVDLKTSVSAIKGIANLAAVSGSNSQQASTAMYQLSQALAAGTVKLQDWNSVVNAGMGGQVFQDSLKETARVHGIKIDEMIKKEGSFRETLQKGWLTSEILTETLSKFTGDLNEKQLKSMGYTDEQIKGIIKMGETANDAATKVKTFTQLWDTLKEAAQSGWTESWEIMVGDFEEAKKFLTEISDTLGAIIGQSANARNEFLSGGLSSGWKQLLNQGITNEDDYKKTIQEVAKSHDIAFDKMIKKEGSFDKALSKGLKDGTISSDILSESVSKLSSKINNMSAKQLEAAGYTADNVKSLNELNKGLKNGSISMDEFAKKIARPSGRENVIDALRNSFKALLNVFTPIHEAFKEVFPPATSEQLYQLTVGLKEFTSKLILSKQQTENIKDTFKGLFGILDIGRKILVAFTKPFFELIGSNGVSSLGDSLLEFTASIGRFLTSINEGFSTNGLYGGLSNIATGISDVLGGAVSGLDEFGDALSGVGSTISKVITNIWDGIQTVFTWITDNITAGDIFAGLTGGGIFLVLKKFSGLMDKVKETIEGFTDRDDSKIGFSDVLSSLHDSLDSFTSGIKISSLVSIAAAIGILAHSVKTLSNIKANDIGKSLLGIGVMVKMLTTGFHSLTKTLNSFNSKGIVKSSVSLILIAEALNILSGALVKISALSFDKVVTGLIGIGGSLAELSIALKIIDKVKINLSTSIVIIALAKACKTLSEALIIFGKMSWDSIARGLTAMGGALGELTAVLTVMNKIGGKGNISSSIGIFVLVQSLSKLANNLMKFGKMSWSQIGRGLIAMGGALSELGLTIGILGKLSGISGIFGAVALNILIQGLDKLSNALSKFGKMSWNQIIRGIKAMGGALSELAIVSGTLGKIAGFSGIFGSTAIVLLIQGLDSLAIAFGKFGSLSWSNINKGLIGMGGALAEVGIVCGTLGKIAGFSGIFGSGAIWITIQGLEKLSASFSNFASMSWDEIKRGLVAMGGALLEVGGISGALGSLTGIAGIIGSGSVLIATQGLVDIADSLKKFGEMSWDEIGRGLASMGAALGEIALGGFLNTLSILGSISISNIAEPLGTLAESIKKWSGVSVPAGLGLQLRLLADGVMSFTLSGLGALSISEVATPLGVLADSVKKWKDIVLPKNLNESLSSISDGVQSFSWAFAGGWSIGSIAEPLGVLAESIKKWKDVTVPKSISEGLTAISDGVQSFTWAFAGGWSISSIAEPLGTLADATKKLAEAKITPDIGTKLKSVAEGVKAFTGIDSIYTATNGITSLADSTVKLSSVNFNSVISGLNSFVDTIKKVGKTSVNTKALSSSISSVTSAISKMMKLLNATVKSGKSDIQSAMTYALSGLSSAVKISSAKVAINISGLINNLNKTIRSKKSTVDSSFKTLVSGAASAINRYKGSFTSAGKNLGAGLVIGIQAKETAVYNAGFALGRKAVQGELDGQDSHSPSKAAEQGGEWLGEGLIIGIKKLGNAVYKAGYNMGDKATQSISNAISTISDVINSDLDAVPTIRPVLDLSGVSAGVGNINSMLDLSPSVGVMANVRAISAQMANRQNGGNSEVVSAINSLKKALGNQTGDTYNLNGLNYQEGSDVAEALKTIVRAARVERRK